MATTSKPISELALGIRDTAGAVVASGKARFYSPSTLTVAAVYSDSLCTTVISQPLTLNAAGQGTVYTLAAVRMIVKDSTETTTYYDDVPSLVRAESVYMTVTGFNGGAETTLNTQLAGLATTFGSGFQYKESTNATARNWPSVIRNTGIQAQDFGVIADGATDDTAALQAACDRVAALGGGKVVLPTGTIKITTAISITTAGVSIEGQSRSISIIKNFGTTTNAITINVTGDSKLFLRNFSISASTTSSGAGISVTAGNYIVIEKVSVGLHRTGIDVSAVTGGELQRCLIDSTDANAAGIGINLGASGRAWHCEVSATNTNGTGIKFSGTDGRAVDCYTTFYATGYNLNSARSIADKCFALSATTGFSVAAVANASVTFSGCSSCTTDLSVNSSATQFVECGNAFATISNAGTAAAFYRRILSTTTTDATATATLTPDLSTGARFFILNATNGGTPTMTINAATGTANIAKGEIVEIILSNASGGTVLSASMTWNAQYKGINGTNTIQSAGVNLSGARGWLYRFRWTGTIFTLIGLSAEAAPMQL